MMMAEELELPLASAIGASKAPIVLLVDDEEAFLLGMVDYLLGEGCQALVALDAREGLRLAHRVRPDVIVMDICLPGMDGFEAIRRLRRDRDLASTPIIAVTALVMPGDRERCLAAGANAYISKPVEPDVLTRAIVWYAQRAR